jgi:hypothetical protein
MTLCDNGSGTIQMISGIPVCVNNYFTTVPKLPASTMITMKKPKTEKILQHRAVSNMAPLTKAYDNVYYCKANGKLGSVTLEKKSTWPSRFEWGCSVGN